MRHLYRSFSLLLLVLFATGVYSQNEKMIRLGLRVAPNIGWMNPDEKEYKYNGVAAGLSLGFVSDFYFSSYYGLSTGFSFLFLDGNLTLPYAADSNIGTVNRKYEFRYLEIPLMMKMRTKEFGKFSFYAQIGFGTAFRLKCKAKDEFITESSGTINEKYTLNDGETSLIRESVLVGAGTEIKLDESISFVLGLSYSNALNNVLNGSNTRYPERTNRSSLNYAEINIGVLF